MNIRNLLKRSDDQTLDREITNTLNAMSLVPKTDDEAMEPLLARLERLYKLKNADRSQSKLSPDAILGAGTSIVSILLIMHHEKLSVISTKAFGFIGKPKL